MFKQFKLLVDTLIEVKKVTKKQNKCLQENQFVLQSIRDQLIDLNNNLIGSPTNVSSSPRPARSLRHLEDIQTSMDEAIGQVIDEPKRTG